MHLDGGLTFRVDELAQCAGIGDSEKARELALYVRKSFEDSGGTYGYRRVHTDLVAWGVPAG